ncbi:AMP-binding protein [Cellulosimicrobium cellulans]|uniref:AMP-binding protein n=1 Tax=Cellulosimicrobium cellulans TaxID=1710 RepID=UPI001962EA4F|nr:AMP-binding protein [Cellulosimicrobium cellulans]MBN0042457.1 AMP-binding protein [Cellulosimicrobium cellulans]
MNRAVVPADLGALVSAVGAALDGDGPPVAPVPPLPRPGRADVPPGAALVLRTSGSTGEPREVVLSAAALRASGAATHQRLGGPGHWLLTLPATHVAGVQVVARAHAAGRGLTVAPEDEPFTPAGFAALVARSPRAERRYVSLVPTQLHRLLAAAEAGSDGGAAALDALCALDAVLLGGAAAPPALLRRARAAGARVVTTYGMTETSGGCVYDGVPLAGARVRLARPTAADGPDGAPGVIELSGPFLADGYLGDPAATAHAFRTDDDGTRWFRTSDLGRLDGSPDGPSLTVLGRADDVVVSGGVNVAPAAVEALVAEVDGVGEACVVGVPHPEWGQEVVAVVTTAEPAPAPPGPGREGTVVVAEAPTALVATVRDHVADRLERAAAPRRVLVVADLPRRGPGKVDRAAVARLAVGHLQSRPG